MSAVLAATSVNKKSKTKDNWTTPLQVKELLLQYTGGRPVYLDPCSNPDSIIEATIEWYGPHVGGTDGLVTPWPIPPGELCFVNNPYSATQIWARKCNDEGQRTRGSIICLIPGDTSTAYFQRYLTQAASRCFWNTRMKFGGDVEGPATFPSLLGYWGPHIGKFHKVFGPYGWCR